MLRKSTRTVFRTPHRSQRCFMSGAPTTYNLFTGTTTVAAHKNKNNNEITTLNRRTALFSSSHLRSTLKATPLSLFTTALPHRMYSTAPQHSPSPSPSPTEETVKSPSDSQISTSTSTSTTTDTNDAQRAEERFDLEQFTQELNRSGETLGEGTMEAPVDAAGDAVGIIGRVWDAVNPVEGISSAMEQLHMFSGLPWWSLIIGACLAMRVALMPVFITVTRNSYKMQKLQPVIQAVKDKHKETVRSQGLAGSRVMQEEVRQVMQKYKVSPFKSFLIGFTQMPVFILFFITLRHMAANIDSFSEGGLAWFKDLSMHDPYGILPVVSGLLMLGSGEVMQYYQKKDNPDAKPPHWAFKWLIRALMLCGPIITFKFPAAIFLYWVANGLLTILQTLILRIPAVRSALRLTDRDLNIQVQPNSSSASGESNTSDTARKSLKTHRRRR